MERMDARTRLEADRATTAARLARVSDDFDAVVTASRDSNADDEHDPEGATIAFERSQIGAVAQQLLRRLAEIDAALRRIDDGQYGVCEVCGQQVGAGRLEARPTARACIGCASASTGEPSGAAAAPKSG